MDANAVTNGEILIVEDDRDFVEDLFTMWSPPWPVARASSGKEAVEYLQTGIPALVLLDLNLPHYLADDDDGEGLGILSYIKTRVDARIPVIIVTRENSDEMRSRAVSLGAGDFIPKPLDVSDLEKAVVRLMRESRTMSS